MLQPYILPKMFSHKYMYSMDTERNTEKVKENNNFTCWVTEPGEYMKSIILYIKFFEVEYSFLH